MRNNCCTERSSFVYVLLFSFCVPPRPQGFCPERPRTHPRMSLFDDRYFGDNWNFFISSPHTSARIIVCGGGRGRGSKIGDPISQIIKLPLDLSRSRGTSRHAKPVLAPSACGVRQISGSDLPRSSSLLRHIYVYVCAEPRKTERHRGMPLECQSTLNI